MSRCWRIAIAGFQHETNTFAASKAGIDEFHSADSWPPLLQGSEVINATRQMNLPISGAILEADKSHKVEPQPIVWCSAEPSGPVTNEAFEWIASIITDALQSGSQFDAIYLDLHGAMVTENFADGEGELLKRLRAIAGPIPIAISLDLHANVTPTMVTNANLISIYRTYPHLDMALTGSRCMHRLLALLDGRKTYQSFRQLPFLVPLHAQCTNETPCDELYRALDTLTESEDEYVELAMGFTASDIYDCGPSIVTAAPTQQRADALADAMLDRCINSKKQFNTVLLDTDEAIEQAMADQSSKPVVLADVQDNAGAGGTSDTTGLLHALIAHSATQTVMGVLCDADVANIAHTAGVGSVISCQLGAKAFSSSGSQPVNGRFTVVGLNDGNIPYTGKMYQGSTASIGKSCLLLLEANNASIQIVVSSRRTQCLDQAFFTCFGIDLTRQKIICVKSTVHYRADFESLASEMISVKAPGVFACDLAEVDYINLRASVKQSIN